ncbi:unnamed protein product [Discosporangium mesarthrocarpum]
MPKAGDAKSDRKGDIVTDAKARYYTPDDVALHNCAEDCWLSLFGKVLDISRLIMDNRGLLADPLIAAAGTDVSHWFSAKTGDPRTFVDPETGLTVPYTPMGRFLHVPPNFPTTAWSTNFGNPWWRDENRVVGKLTRKGRSIRIVNILSQQEDLLLVACEDSIADIQERYLESNAHAGSYTWKVLKDSEFVPADMDKTLEENGVLDDDLEFDKLGMGEGGFIPVLHIYYNDDLTVA